MVIIGLLLVLLAVVVALVLILGTQSEGVSDQLLEMRFLDTVTIDVSPLALLIAGMVVMFVFWLGLVTIRTALMRRAHQRKERKRLETEARERQAQREQEVEQERQREQQEREQQQREYEQRLHEQQLSTQAARERAEVAEGRAEQATSELGQQRSATAPPPPGGVPVEETQRIDPRERPR